MSSNLSASRKDLHGLLIGFEEAEDLVAAARRVQEAGYHRIDAYTPMPVHGLAEALGVRRTRLPLIVLMGGLVGGLIGFGFQVWVSVYAYPHNVGGRPYFSWPAFIPVTFELTILGSALFCILGMLALNGLPKPHHPLFAVPEFARATQDRFFLCIEASDPRFDEVDTRILLRGLTDSKVVEVNGVD